ncbi:MAG: protein phosphatase 2C domain-containing protein [Actinomycetota bacterium]|nr:protein phosphatase 2C domain-containing protein [Actinomycetota bacterium]MDQ6933814.1 protein phosphatase 2C domain-containing protein [Actinomycetota bacterium]
MSLRLHFAALSDVGRVRRDNQDSGYAGEHLLVVADGVGGAARGDIASSTAIEQLSRLDDEQPDAGDALAVVAGAIHRTHDRIAELVEEHPELDGTSTTLTAAVFDGVRLGVGHVGDSRGYLLRDGVLSQLTTDHTFVQSLIDEGRITEEEARVHPHRNLILRAVDGVHEPEPDVFHLDLEPGDRILLCSDGCSGVLGTAELTDLLGAGSVEQAGHRLVQAALDAGSSDNVTVVLADVVADPAAADTAEAGTAGAGAAEAAAPVEALVVGAAARSPVKSLGKPGRGLLRGLRSGDTGELDPVPGVDADPEAMRYAPRPPRRHAWLRRLAVLVVGAVVLGLVGTAAYAWTQTQYFVAPAGNRVAIYRGIEANIPGLRMHRVAEQTALSLGQLPPSYARQVREGISADGLSGARMVVKRLHGLAVCPPPGTGQATGTPTASPTSTGTPSHTPTGTPTHGTTAQPTRKPTAGSTLTGSAAPHVTHYPTTRPTQGLNLAGTSNLGSSTPTGTSANSTNCVGSR